MGAGRCVGGAEDFDGAVLAVVAGGDAEMRLLLGRQGIANLRHGTHQFIPADLLAQVAVVRKSEVAKRAARCQRQNDGADIGRNRTRRPRSRPSSMVRRPQRGREASQRSPSPRPWPAAWDKRRPCSSRGPCRRRRARAEPDTSAPACGSGDCAGKPTRPASQSGAAARLAQMQELALPESLGAAFAHVARVNVLEEVVGDEVVAHEPDEVGQKDQQRQRNAAPRTSGSRSSGARA